MLDGSSFLITTSNDHKSPMSAVPEEHSALITALTELAARLHPKSPVQEFEHFLAELQRVADVLHPDQYIVFPKVVSFTDGTNKSNKKQVLAYKPEFRGRAELTMLLATRFKTGESPSP